MTSAATRTREVLQSLGYEQAHLRTEFPVLTDRGQMTADLVAFGRGNGPYDASTATLLVELKHRGEPPVDTTSLEPLLQMAVALSVPAVIVAGDQGWDVYGVDDKLTIVRSLTWSAEPGELRQVLSPRALLEAKLGHRQLSLFPAAVVASARGRRLREGTLAPRVAKALDATASATLAFDHYSDQATAHARAARLVIGALTAVVLRDKDEADQVQPFSAGSVLDRALQRHPRQFAWLTALPHMEQELLDGLVAEFTDLDYTSVEPELLSQLYEQRLVDDAFRRRLGTHYTSPGLARRLLAWMPIEEIAPSARTVLDPTCGSGGLLVAAHDRLRDLEPDRLSPDEIHAALVTRLLGADLDPVAVAIADLALFLNALPAGNGWHIEEGDSFSSTTGKQATIIVANPPWAYSNVTRQDDQAQRMLNRLIADLPAGGLLGMILPVGWLTRRSPAARRSRERVAEALELLEVWRLPQGTFTSADMGAAVLIARKPPPTGSRGHTFVVRRISNRAGLNRFFEQGDNACFMSRDPGADRLSGGPLHTWYTAAKRRERYTIGSYASAVVGPQPEAPTRLALRSSARPPNTRLVDWRTVTAFGEAHNSAHRPARFPDDMQGASKRGGAMLGRRKIFVSGVKNPERPWRIKVALDDGGDLLVRNTVTAVIPQPGTNDETGAGETRVREETVLYGLFAFLGSGFASAWLDETVSTRYMSTEDLLSVPAPDPSTLKELATIGRRLLAEGPQSHIIDALERAVWSWAEAPTSVQTAVIDRLNGMPAPEGRLRYSVAGHVGVTSVTGPSDTKFEVPRLRAGAVLAVHDQAVSITVPGRTPESGVTIPLPQRMPGALLHPHATFIVLDDGGSLESLTYRFDSVAYLDDLQIVQLLSDPANALPIGL